MLRSSNNCTTHLQAHTEVCQQAGSSTKQHYALRVASPAVDPSQTDTLTEKAHSALIGSLKASPYRSTMSSNMSLKNCFDKPWIRYVAFSQARLLPP